jgi:hypothetical protein
MRSKPILHGQVTQSLLLLPLGSSQRHDIRTARPTPNATRSRRDQGNAQPYPPPPPRGSRRSAARSTRRLGVSRKPQRSSCARDPTGGAHPSERERPPDILKRIPPSSVTPETSPPRKISDASSPLLLRRAILRRRRPAPAAPWAPPGQPPIDLSLSPLPLYGNNFCGSCSRLPAPVVASLTSAAAAAPFEDEEVD